MRRNSASQLKQLQLRQEESKGKTVGNVEDAVFKTGGAGASSPGIISVPD